MCIRKYALAKSMRLSSLLIFSSLFLCSCASKENPYELDSVAHYATRHAKEGGWHIEAMEKFDIGEYRGPYFEVAYYDQGDLGVTKMRNLLASHIVKYLEDNENNKKLITSVKAKDRHLSYRNLAIDLSFYTSKENKNSGPIAFVTYRAETVRYWIQNELAGKYELVHVESIHDALEVCNNNAQHLVQDDLRSNEAISL